uniref:ANK_REP_REGION domain-containing protein n=1 Tax=Nothobranchius furzeri TaxID=105023 RepID=A0A8C6M9D1_NOTFU
MTAYIHGSGHIRSSCGKLRLVRLLVDGGAQVNGSNSRGALLAACEALRGEAMLRLNQADPNARAALMHACTERAGVHVAQSLLAAGADPCMEDVSGASALVYAINAQHQPTVQPGVGIPSSSPWRWTGSPNSSEEENIFSFRGTSESDRSRSQINQIYGTP